MGNSMNRLGRHSTVTALAACGFVAGVAIFVFSCGGEGGTALRVANSCPREHEGTDGVVIATGILSRSSDDLVLDARELDDLTKEIDRTLGRIRSGHPELNEIHARETPFIFGQVVVGLDQKMEDTVHRLVTGGSARTVEFVTDNEEFDSLNARLGLRGVESTHDSAVLCFSDGLNVPVASDAYSTAPGIRYAEPNGIVGDGPDIEALRRDDTWYVLFRDAWGDCPAGCIEEDLSFFTVSGDQVADVGASQAASNPNFADLIRLVGSRQSTTGG